jgi:hypothetical protein
MSLRATTWALYDVGPDLADAQARLILLVLADNADDDGRGAAVSKRTMAVATGLGESTIYRRLRALQESGLIAPGDDRIVAYLPADKRPRVWDLPRVRGAAQAPRRRKRGAPLAPRGGVSAGCQRGASGVSLLTQDPDDPGDPLDPESAGGDSRPAGALRVTADRIAQLREAKRRRAVRQ